MTTRPVRPPPPAQPLPSPTPRPLAPPQAPAHNPAAGRLPAPSLAADQNQTRRLPTPSGPVANLKSPPVTGARLSRLRRALPAVPRAARFILQGVFGLALLGMLSLTILYLMVLTGPISIGFLVGPFEEAIARELGAGRVAIGNAVLRQSEDGRGIEFRLANLTIMDARGVVLAETPLAGISLSGSAILRGRLAPVSVEFIRPRLHLATTPEGGLALAVSRPAEGSAEASPQPPSAAALPADSATPSAATAAVSPGPIDLVAALRQTMTEFRQSETASAYLRELGVRDATLTIAHAGHQAVWHVPGFTIDVQHFQKRSVIAGEGLIGSAAGAWGLSFRTTESDKAKRLRFEAEIAELTPQAIASNLSFLPGLAALGMPVAGTAKIDIALDSGQVDADVKLLLSPGRLELPEALGGAVQVTGGALHLTYGTAERRLVLHPSEVSWNQSRATWAGFLMPDASNGATDADRWRFALASQSPRIEGLTLDSIDVSGHMIPRTQHTRIDKLAIRVQGTQIALSGGSMATDNGPALQLDGTIGAMSLPALLAAWPRSFAPEAAEWLKARVAKGRIAGGTVRLTPAAARPRVAPTGPTGHDLLAGLALDLELADLQVTPLAGVAPVLADQARLRLDRGRLEMTTAQVRLPLPSGRQVVVKDPRLVIAQLTSDAPQAEVTLQSTAPASALLELLNQEPLSVLRGTGFDANIIEGRGEASLKAVFPATPQAKLADVKFEGRIRLTEARSKGLLGPFEISGGSLLLGLTEKALDAKGDILVAGVPAKITWQRIFGAPADRQPPARITATLDSADRDALGIDVNHIVQGDVPIAITVQADAQGQPLVHLEANLGAAELLLDTMAWRKPAGRPAVLHSDIVRTKDGRTELQGFKIVGDDVALDGSLSLDAKNELRAFHFPAFTVNVLTKLDVSGRVRDDGVLEVKTKGTAYDGRPFFRSLFSAGQITERSPPQAKKRLGLDLAVEIDTIVGYTDTNLRNVQFTLKRRGDKIVALKAVGALSDSGVPVNAEIRLHNNTRVLTANTADAGSAMRLIGFYPNMVRGNGVLEVNLDGKGHAEKTGRLQTSDFAILGDAIVDEVLQGNDAVRRRTRKIDREQIKFDRLDVPFSVGHGQVVLGETTINGALLGARLNGKIDYNRQTVFLEGTYVPLYGLNSIPNSLPIIGDILNAGRSGEGLFGITFQIQGPMGQPQVLVNPLSLMTPGFLRQIWETAPQGQSVVPRSVPQAPMPPSQASSAPAQTGEARPAPTKAGESRAAPSRASSSGPQRVEPMATPGVPAPATTSPPPRTPTRDRTAPTRDDGQ